MASRVRLLLRCARVLVACVVLSLIATPGRVALSTVDAVAWVAGAAPARAAAAEARDVVDPARGTEATSAPGVTRALRPRDPRIVRRPAGARVVVAHRRIYLRHAALLC